MIENNYRILLVEENAEDILLLRDLLCEDGALNLEIEQVNSMDDGVCVSADRVFDIVLLNMNLLNGRSAGIGQAFTSNGDSPVPVIILANESEEAAGMRVLEGGAMDLLVKESLTSPLLIRSVKYAIARHRTEAALRESEERYRLAVQGVNDGVWDWNIEESSIYFSPRWKEILGHEDSNLSNHPQEWFRRVHPADLNRLREQIEDHLRGATPSLECEHRLMHSDGAYRWTLVRGVAERSNGDKAKRMAGSLTDITERRRAEEQLQHDALHDLLTGLPNRALFMDHLRLAINRARRCQGHMFAVLSLDLDGFKVINEGLGHEVGDEVLVATAHLLNSCIRPGDTLARLGGDEFAILLDEIDSISIADCVAKRVQETLNHPFNVDGREVYTSVCIGIALSTSTYFRAENVMRDAETALYRAKESGRGGVEIFEQNMHQTALDLLNLETTLRQAVQREEFTLHYQPVVHLASGRLTGFEALVRWNHPERGLLRPDDFIPMAEETGLIVPIGRWVLGEACRQLRQWQDDHSPADPFSVSVNLSSRELKQPNFIREITDLIKDSRIDARSLKLEITESAIMNNAREAVEILWQLKNLNLHINIDDFGTGYSSLSYLHRFPIDNFKIDRSFISNLDQGAENQEIVRAILMLAGNLGMDVTAEGIETESQLHMLRQLGCRQGQGFYFARPMDQVEAGEMLIKLKSNPTFKVNE